MATTRKRKKTKTKDTRDEAGFADLLLSESMLQTLDAIDYHAPTPIQAGMIPSALEGKDIVGQAQTGTGKTAAFGIPIVERLDQGRRKAPPRALILVPTRELAVQVRGELVKLAAGRQLMATAVYGGKPIREQIEKLRKGSDIVVGTPGRVLDHMGRRTLQLDELEIVVLDEADRMLDIGFRPDIERILRQCPQQRQTMLLSATVPDPIQRMAQRYMTDPIRLNFSSKDLSVETIEQSYFTVDHGRKFDLLAKLLKREEPAQAIIFCRTKRRTDSVHRRLRKLFANADCMHGDMAQSDRDQVMAKFRSGKLRYLVATDVVGRGIDVTGVSHIINFDTPQFCDDYVHRVGRTGRMGREGVAYTFVAPEEGPQLTRIEQRINRELVRDEMRGFEPNEPSVKELPPERQPPPPPPGRRRPPRRHRRAL